MRSLRELDELKATEWTAEETLYHLTDTFERAARRDPDLMERYVVMLADAESDADKLSIMRRGLRETINQRYK
jgi:hypothetical protein